MMVYFKGGRLLAAAALTALGAAGGAMLMSSANGADSASSRLQQVADRQAIEQLLTGDYPRALDHADWKAYAALFTEDGELSAGGSATPTRGRAAIEAQFSRPRAPTAAPATPPPPNPCPVQPGKPRTQHVVTNLTVQINGDTATDQAYWMTLSTRECRSVVAGSGHYEDELKKVAGKWYFAKRAIIDDLPPRTPRPPAAPGAPATPPAQ
jgi:hypothetical protein